MNFDYMLGFLANILEIWNSVFVSVVLAWYTVTQYFKFKDGDLSREVSATLSQLRQEGERTIVHIRPLQDATLEDTLGGNTHASKRLLKRSKSASKELMVLNMESATSTRSIMKEVESQIGQLCGPGFLANEIRGSHDGEVEFILVVGVRRINRFSWTSLFHATKVRVHVIKKSSFDKMVMSDDLCNLWELAEQSNEYDERDRFLRRFIPQYQAWLEGKPGTETLAIKITKLTM